MAEAIDDCQSLIAAGLLDAATARAASYVSDSVWNHLARDWSGRHCAGLASVARHILYNKSWVHAKLGRFIGVLVASFGTPPIVVLFAEQVSKRLPLPWDHQLTATARGAQITGIILCVLNDRGLGNCACLIDLVKTEGNDRLHELLVGAAEQWVRLHGLVPRLQAAELAK